MRHHAGLLASQMQLLLAYDMVPLVMPGDAYLTSWPHQAGSALFFGCTLGVLNALICMAVSLIPWKRGRFSLPDLVVNILLGCLFVYLSFSRELPAVSFLFGFVCPLIFFLTWSWFIRRSTERRVHHTRWLVIFLVMAAPFAGLVTLGTASFEIIRDSMLEMPVARTLSDFYYDHTLLAAHVIKPPSALEQKIIALSEDIVRIGTMPHGTLWIRSSDPCGIPARTLTVSTAPLACRSIVLTDRKPANTSNRIIHELGGVFDDNARMRSGIGLFFYQGPLLFIPVLFMLWLSLSLSGLCDRNRIIAVLAILGYLALFIGPGRTVFLQRQLRADPGMIHRYVLSEQENKRYLAIRTFPGELSDSELLRFSGDPSARIRLNALFEAGKRRNPEFMGMFEEALADSQLNVRTRACWSLGALKTAQARSLLERVLHDDPSWYVRGYAYRALGTIRPGARMVSDRKSS